MRKLLPSLFVNVNSSVMSLYDPPTTYWYPGMVIVPPVELSNCNNPEDGKYVPLTISPPEVIPLKA